MKKYFILAFKGFLMGVADIIPGVSGGTIAFITGIYEDWINAIKSVDFHFGKLLMTGKLKEAFRYVQWEFLFSLCLGIASAILLLSHLLDWLLTYKLEEVYSVFFGLILMTVPILFTKIERKSLLNLMILFLSSFFAAYVFMMVPVNTPEVWWFVMLSGALAICAMILPGISGAFILVLLGKYQFVLRAIHQFDLLVIFIFGLGVVLGVLLFVRLLSWCLRRYHNLSFSLLTGLVIGSLFKIWPWKYIEETGGLEGKVINVLPDYSSKAFYICLFLMVLGAGVAFVLNKFSGEKRVN